jgi:choline-sulfatase
MLGKFGMWWKCSLYEDSVRIPCIASGPDFQVNHQVETPVDLLDVQASLFEVTEVERPLEWVGIPLNKIEQNDTERFVFAEYHGHATYSSSYMVRQNNWKYLHYINAPDQLFNLQEDPDEINNLLDNQPEVRQKLLALLEKICNPLEECQRAETFIETQLTNYQTMLDN